MAGCFYKFDSVGSQQLIQCVTICSAARQSDAIRLFAEVRSLASHLIDAQIAERVKKLTDEVPFEVGRQCYCNNFSGDKSIFTFLFRF